MSKTYKPKPVVNLDVPIEDFVIEAADVEALQVEFAEPQKPSDGYIVQDGDTYASIGKKLAPAGVSGFAMAKTVHALNGGKNLVPGEKVRV